MNRTHELAYWINERETIRLRKEHSGTLASWKHGWHDDPFMGRVRYCNVRREDDKVTQWLAEHWRPHYHEVWQILLARLINNIPTLMRLRTLLDYADPLEHIRTRLKELREYGPIFGSAYTVSTNGRSMDKVDYIIDYVVAPAKERGMSAFGGASLQNAADWLCTLYGVSDFMAGQIIADLKNTKGHPLEAAPDWWDWAAPGPGSLRGLAAYFGCPIRTSQFTDYLSQCYTEVQQFLTVGELHMQDFQNCMCEFSKYVRVKEGGHVRNRYNPR